MKFNLVILGFLIIATSSCCAQKAHSKREKKNITNELSFINNKSINFSIKKVACETCFPIFDIGYRVRVKLIQNKTAL